MTNEIKIDVEKPYLLTFSFTNKSLIPRGIRWIQRRTKFLRDRQHLREGKELNLPHRGLGYQRPNEVDTGLLTELENVSLESAWQELRDRHPVTDAHYDKIEKEGRVTKHKVMVTFGGSGGTPPKSSTVRDIEEKLIKLSRWRKARHWENPEGKPNAITCSWREET